MKNPFYDQKGGIKYKNIFIILGIVIFLLLINPFYIVQSTERGLLFNWGAIENKVVSPGLNFKIPFVQNVHKISILPIVTKVNIPVGGDGAITKDNQTIGTEIVAFYRYDESQLVKMYSSIGEEKAKNIIETGLKEAVKSTIGTYSIFTIAERQKDIVKEALAALKAKVSEYPMTITEIRILNWDWSDEYDKQIDLTMKRAQEVKQKEQELIITQTETQKLVAQAEAEKKVTIAKAEGEFAAAKLQADARAEQGRGEKDYNNAIAATLNIQIRLKELEIEMIKANAWDGHYVPNNMYGPIPISQGGIQGK
jgi:regulator of protease activity HflC (stomatin/prohibitin superfamily)